MSSETSKGADTEIPIFLEFAAAANLLIDAQSVEKRMPPDPDIRCRLSTGELVAYELVEICDQNIAKDKINGSYIRTSDPSVEIVKKKLKKSYPPQLPVELLCYKNGRVVSPDGYIAELLSPILSGSQFQYRKVWLFSSRGAQLLWPPANHSLQAGRP